MKRRWMTLLLATWLIPACLAGSPDGPAEPPGREAPAAETIRTLAVVLDTFGMERADLRRVQAGLAELLRSEILPPDLEVQLLLEDLELRPVAGLTRDRTSLVRLLAGMEPGFTGGQNSLVLPKELRAKGEPTGPLADLDGLLPRRSFRGDQLIATFTRMAEVLEPRPGRKLILWVSAGGGAFPEGRRFSERDLRRWEQAATKARVAFATVDARQVRPIGGGAAPPARRSDRQQQLLRGIAAAMRGELFRTGTTEELARRILEVGAGG